MIEVSSRDRVRRVSSGNRCERHRTPTTLRRRLGVRRRVQRGLRRPGRARSPCSRAGHRPGIVLDELAARREPSWIRRAASRPARTVTGRAGPARFSYSGRLGGTPRRERPRDGRRRRHACSSPAGSRRLSTRGLVRARGGRVARGGRLFYRNFRPNLTTVGPGRQALWRRAGCRWSLQPATPTHARRDRPARVRGLRSSGPARRQLAPVGGQPAAPPSW